MASVRNSVISIPFFSRIWVFPKAIQLILHSLFWLFYFSAINVDWGANWLDRSIRLNTPSPFSVVLFPLIFYVLVFQILPGLRNKKSRTVHLAGLAVLFLLPELLRLVLFTVIGDFALSEEIFSRDSFLFGSPNLFWMSVVASILYRFTFERPVRYEKSAHGVRLQNVSAVKTELSEEEAKPLLEVVHKIMRDSELFLDPNLSLRSLATRMDITDKKLSMLLNQHLGTSFSDYVNEQRIKRFLSRARKGELENLSIEGLARQCGFPSKSSFYRSFKKITGQTPGSILHKDN